MLPGPVGELENLMARDIATHSTDAITRFQGPRACGTSKKIEGLEGE